MWVRNSYKISSKIQLRHIHGEFFTVFVFVEEEDKVFESDPESDSKKVPLEEAEEEVSVDEVEMIEAEEEAEEETLTEGLELGFGEVVDEDE